MRRLELGHIWYGLQAQRTKINTETIYLMLCRTFDELDYRRAEWKCDALNAHSRAAALRLGFRFEGTFRQHLIYKGRNRDTAWFAMMDHEWPRIKANMERWLAAEEPGLSLAALNRE
jgi:RimJ/RimL family protein N-acetyltransferase